MNVCMFSGRLTADPELRRTPNGADVLNITLAIPREYPTKDGEWPTDFIDFVAWNKLAKKIAEKYKKGDLLEVRASLQPRTTKDKEGKTHTYYDMILNFCRKLGSPKGTEKEPTEDFTPVKGDDSDLPFETNQ